MFKVKKEIGQVVQMMSWLYFLFRFVKASWIQGNQFSFFKYVVPGSWFVTSNPPMNVFQAFSQACEEKF